MLADEPFAKAWGSLDKHVSINDSLYGRLVSSLESRITFDERFEVTSVPFFILDFKLLNWKLANFTFKVLYWVSSYWC